MNPVWKALRSSLLAAASLLLAQVAMAAAYTFTSVSHPGFDNTFFWDINNTGLISGFAYTNDDSMRTGFVYNRSTGVFTDLPGPAGALFSDATGISDTGVVVGAYGYSADSVSNAFIYSGGAYSGFSVPGATSTFLRGISPDARYLTGLFETPSTSNHGFVFDRDTGALADLGEWTIVQGVNSHGVVAGSVFLPRSNRTPFLYDIATGIRTDYAPTTSRYRDINDAGVVAGFDGGSGIVGMPGSTVELTPPGAVSSAAYGINNAGVVVGWFDTDPSFLATQGFIATPVAEPGTWALMFGGLLGLGAMRRRVRH